MYHQPSPWYYLLTNPALLSLQTLPQKTILVGLKPPSLTFTLLTSLVLDNFLELPMTEAHQVLMKNQTDQNLLQEIYIHH
jgi:hypothetical protein